MDTKHQDFRRQKNWRNAQIAVRFTNAAHFADCLDFLAKTNQAAEFWKQIGGLATMFRRDAAGQKGGQFGPPGEPPDPDVPPVNINLWLSPDSLARPSFVWRAEAVDDIPGSHPKMILHGGLIYRDNEGWTIHT